MAVAFCFLTLSLVAERQPFERYQSIIDRQMFGQPPPGFDPTRPPSEVAKGSGKDEVALTRDQEQLKSSVHFSVLNMSPDGTVSVGFTDNADAKSPKHYYLKLGEERDGWKVLEADAAERMMTVEKDGVEVSLKLGGDSGGGAPAKGGEARTGSGLLANRMSFRERRRLEQQQQQADAAKLAEEAKAREAREAEEKQQREAERAEQREQLLRIQEELRKAREARESQKEAAGEDQPEA